MRATKNGYQIALILLLILVILLYGFFFQRELNPEYKVFQNTFVELEKIRGSNAPFEFGIKQILLKEGKGPEEIDRCISCHVALDVEAYSPKSPNYIFNKPEAEKYKTVRIGEHVYDMEKTLVMHPLIGNETRPFEFHPIDQYGCVSCHGGNGRGLTVETAHGPVFDDKEVQVHDPRFARMFNEKPDEKLLFQTTPLLIGGLMEAKCAQCHKQEVALPHFERGKELFVEQGCYACHKIEGFSRGGIGPELTREGLSYPWFIKESIVWPQADLKSSQMPNQKLDHEEVEDLMTFLLAQRGGTQVVSPIERKRWVRAWENGKKNAFEEEIDLKTLEDVHAGMKTFAMEGCAGCHKLEGFTSEVGYVKPEGREWFRRVVPEDISANALVEVVKNEPVETYLGNVKPVGILEQVDLKSFYAPFKVAERAAPGEPLEKVIKMYYQEYGFGRMIGPRLNWSGVYRTDEWLMEHFWNPQSRTPRSLMPAMPFDDTKFRQLTTMLDLLGEQNLARFKEEPFQPAAAYQQLCAQCHGPNLQGNGPVAQWIYPIPMNLRNADFMKNFTKPQVIEVITHGVKGTPMAPWGENPNGGEPVLTKDQIEQMANWIFDQLPGGEKYEVPKWQENFEVNLPKQVEEGGKLFAFHCAMCHGTEADGGGFRAESMQDAKPRMLTNVDWINSHDDTFLLRAIKYGVPGTSMIGFGDVTTPEQRLQLVAFIRSLSKTAVLRAKYQDLIYQAFDGKEKEILAARRDDPENGALKATHQELIKERAALTSLGNLIAEKEEIADAYTDYLQTLNRKTFLDRVEALKDEKLKGQIQKALP